MIFVKSNHTCSRVDICIIYFKKAKHLNFKIELFIENGEMCLNLLGLKENTSRCQC